MNMNADLIVVDSCGTNGDWQNNNSFYFLISILCSFNISMNRDAFFFHFCILLLLLYSHFYYICSYFIVFYCFFNTRISINFRFSYTYCYEMHTIHWYYYWPFSYIIMIYMVSCYFKILLSIIIWIFDAESFCFCTVQYTRVDWYFQNKVVNKIA